MIVFEHLFGDKIVVKHGKRLLLLWIPPKLIWIVGSLFLTIQGHGGSDLCAWTWWKRQNLHVE